MSQQKKLKVIHIATGIQFAGVERYILGLLQASQNECEYLLVCRKAGVLSDLAAKYCRVEILPISGYLDLGAVKNLRRLIEEFAADVVHVHLGLDSFIAALACRNWPGKLVASVHLNHPNFMFAHPLLRELWRQVQIVKDRRIDRFLAITDVTGQELMRREKVSPTKVLVINTGVTPPSPKLDLGRDSIRESLHVKDRLVILCLARLAREKGIDTLIEAMKSVVKHVPQAVALIAGEGPQRATLEKQAAGMADYIKFLGFRSDTDELLNAADIVALPSRREPFGLAAVEAMMLALPVVGSKVSGLATIVDDGESGILVPPEDPQALADAIKVLAENQELRARMGQHGQKKALAKFTADAMSKAVIASYRQGIAQC